jgi:hypothetical protein
VLKASSFQSLSAGLVIGLLRLPADSSGGKDMITHALFSLEIRFQSTMMTATGSSR